MKFEMPRILKVLPVEEYAPELKDSVRIEVWVNPPRGKVLEQLERNVKLYECARKLSAVSSQLSADSSQLSVGSSQPAVTPSDAQVAELTALGGETEGWLAEMWSQGKEKWTAEEVRELADGLVETDPGLFTFLQERTIRLMMEHRGAVKKK